MVTIRPANSSDLKDILDINNHEILHSTINYDFVPKTLQEQNLWFEEKVKQGFPVLVALTEQKVVGFATYGTFRPKPGYRFTVEHSVYLEQNHRGKGIGTALLQELINLAKKAGIHVMVGGIDSSNYGSYLFHQKLGFQEIGRFKEVGHKFDRWLDIIFMQLILEEKIP
ncbi:GNAT family N-acetyltransferase [Algoriphagus namhaensis]|uniref:GNAT family N-acetyltransferase n=1 Tax=Algoriphagus namhaensis TaxID=915353 RepID=A0ABV8AMC1_9BACT